MEKPAPVEVPITEILARRWSGRAIDPAHAVDAESLRAILEAARWAPSCFNEQPWRFLVFDHRNPNAREAARDCLGPGNQWARRAPLLMLSVARGNFARNGKPNRHAQHDVGMASENLALEACARGLVVHFMAGYDAEKARARFAIPEDQTPMAMLALGWPGRVEDLDEKLRERELAPRARKPLDEIVVVPD